MKIPWLAKKQLALHLAPTQLRAIVFKGSQILRWGTQDFSPQVLQHNSIAQPSAFQEALNQLLTNLKLSAPKTRLSFHHGQAIQRVLSLPPVPDKLLAETVERLARREFPLPLEELYLSWQPRPTQGSERQIFAVGLPRNSVDSYLNALKQAQLKVTTMDLKGLALMRAVNHPQIVIVDLEPNVTQVLLIRDFIPQIARSVSLLDADQFTAQDRANKLIREIQRMLDFHQSSRKSSEPKWIPQLCLSGTLAAESELKAPLAANWNLVEPQPELSIPPELPILEYLPNLGLILKEA